MKEINLTTTEQALAMYKENVSPPKENLRTILSQIPEQKKSEKRGAIRSPYIWLAITEIAMLCSVLFAVLPTLTKIMNDPFYQIDKEVEIFEMGIQNQDYQDNLINSTL